MSGDGVQVLRQPLGAGRFLETEVRSARRTPRHGLRMDTETAARLEVTLDEDRFPYPPEPVVSQDRRVMGYTAEGVWRGGAVDPWALDWRVEGLGGEAAGAALSFTGKFAAVVRYFREREEAPLEVAVLRRGEREARRRIRLAEPVEGVAISPDGRRVAVGESGPGERARVRLYDARSGEAGEALTGLAEGEGEGAAPRLGFSAEWGLAGARGR